MTPWKSAGPDADLTRRIASPSPPSRWNSRANWVALKTLRQVPKVLGKSKRGEPIVEIRGARMVLQDDSTHFNRLVICTNCAREYPGPAVMSPSDLGRAPVPFVCRDCTIALRAPAAATRGAGVELQESLKEWFGDALERQSTSVGASQAALRTAVDARIDQIQAELDRRTAEEGAGATRLEALEARIKQLEAGIAAETARAHAEAATLRSAVEEVARIEAQLNARMDSLSERAAAVALAEDERLQAVDAKVQEAKGQLAAAAGAQRQEFQAALQHGLEEVRAAATVPAETLSRVQAVETQGLKNQGEMAELGELHAALDAGLGTLRSDIVDLRNAIKRGAAGQADLDDRLEAFFRASMVPEGEQGRGGRVARGRRRTVWAPWPPPSRPYCASSEF